MKKAYQRFIAMLIVISISMSVILPTRNVTYAAGADEDEANLFETAISRFLMIGGLSLYALVGIATGPAESGDGSAAPLTIESLFFNRYDKTRLALFGDSAGTNSLLTDDANGLKERVNNVFSFFTKLAVIVYMLMLVYIGIRILLNAGTEKNAKYKEFLVYWVQGVAILFLFPYVIKYTIMINNAFVEFIAENKDNIGAITEVAKPAGITSDGTSSMGGMMTFIETAKTFLTEGSDYMSVMFQKGWDEGWLVYALCFLVMVKQLIALIIIYFKRLLITIFLIAVFPLVTVSYAIDKLGDGKSQAFGNWVKEFILNVFIQSFHAIVYVIGMALIVRIGESADVADSWLLIVILITFISKGDDLLKNIFNIKGGGGDTVQGIGKTALQTKGAIKLAQDGAGLVSRTVGRESKLAEFGHHAAGYAGAARDYASAYMDASNAALSEELFPAPETFGQPTPRIDPSTIETNLSEDRKQEILSEMLSILDIEDESEREQKIEEFKKTLEEDPEALQFVEALLQVGAAGAAATVTGDLEVNLDQRIEIILEQMRNGKLAGNKDLINKLRMANEVKFKRPEHAVLMSLTGRRANAGGRRANEGTRRKGDRYSGVFTQSTGANAGTGNAPQTVAGGVKTGLRYKIARTTASTINRFKAGNKIRGMEKKAVKDVRALRRIERQLKNKNLTALERAKLESARKKIQSGRTLQALRAQRESYAAQGIYFVGIGRTQRTLNRIAGRDAAWNATKTTAKSTWKAVAGTGDRIKTNRTARKAAKEAVKLKQKRFKEGRLSHTETNRLIEAENLVNRHAKERGHGRMTVAQRRLNRGTNRLAVKEARKALDLRKQAEMLRSKGNVKDANKLDLDAMKLEKRVMNTRGRAIKGSTKLRRTTRAQRILDRGQQAASLEKLREIRSKSPDRMTEAEKKILERSNKMRSELRAKGVLLSNGSKVEREYNSAGRMTRKQELQALGTVVGARATMAGKMVGDRVFGGKMGDYTAERKRIEDASNSLRKRGIIIRDSRAINSLDRRTADFRHQRDTKDDRKAARKDLRKHNRSTLQEKKAIDERRRGAEAEIRRAGRAVKRAGNDPVALQRARDREKAAINALKTVQADNDALARQTKAHREQFRERGIVLSNMNFAMNRSKRIEDKINRTTAKSYQTALRREMAADRRVERADIAVQRLERRAERQERRYERREARTDRIIDGATKLKLSPIRQMAEAQQQRREVAHAKKESAMATKLSEVMSRQQFARESSEAAALHRSVSQTSVQTNNIATGTTSFGNRFMNTTSQGFHDFVTTPNRVRTSVETFVSDTSASVRDKIASAKQTAAKIGEGATDVWSTVSKPGELVGAVRAEMGNVSHETPPTISPEIAELAAKRKADNVIKITKVHTSPAEESAGSNVPIPSSERETVVVIRDSNESYSGSLSGKNVLSVNSQKDYDRAKKLAADAKAEVAAVTSKASDSSSSSSSKKGEPSADEKMMRTATMLAASIVAINQSSNGDYTAAEIVAHIDSVRAIMKDQTPGTPEYEVCANLLTKLKYNLDDYESNVRIQVLNDPSLIDSADPRREGIIDSSITHVKSLPSDEVLLSMLRYEPGELQEGYTPMARTSKAYNSVASFVATGIATGYQEPEVQGAFSAGLRDRYKQSKQEAAERAMDQAAATMRKEAGAMLTSGLEAAADLTIGAPIAIGLGMMGAGAGSAGKGSSTLQAGLSGMGTYAVANKGYEGAKTFVKNRVEDTTTVASSIHAALKKNNDSSK